jgi:hypothetical protein
MWTCQACVASRLIETKLEVYLMDTYTLWYPGSRTTALLYFFLRESITLLIITNHYIESAGYNPEQSF